MNPPTIPGGAVTGAKLGSGMAGGSLAQIAKTALSKTGIGGLLTNLGVGRADPEISFRYFLEIDGISCVRFKEVAGELLAAASQYFIHCWKILSYI